MMKLATAITAIALIATPAFAADMPVKSAPLAPAPAVYNWTGWYAGVNAGASFGSVKTDFNAPVNLAVSIVDIGSGAGGDVFAGSGRTNPSGFIGGGQIGYNWQYSPLIVVGLEADFQGALEKDQNTQTGNVSGSFPLGSSGTASEFFSAPTAITYQTKIDWFGTVRGRIGYVWGNGNVMSYLTGGLAYGKVDLEGTSSVSVLTLQTQAFGHSHVNTGWVLGYGTEGVIDFWGARNWTWKIEGLYMDLGTLDTTSSVNSSTAFGTLSSTTSTLGPVTTHSHFTDGILRGGLNYKFY